MNTLEASWSPTKPNMTVSCNPEDFTLTTDFYAAADGYTQENEIQVGDDNNDTNCVQPGIVVTNETVSINVTSGYGNATNPACKLASPNVTFVIGNTSIEYHAVIRVSMKVEKNGLQRTYLYEYSLKCSLNRELLAKTSNFSVRESDVEEVVAESVEDTFNLPVEMYFRDTNKNRITSAYFPTNGETLDVYLEEDPESSVTKFTVQKCFASSEADPTSNTATTADLIDNECNLDQSINISPGGDSGHSRDQSAFGFNTRAFTLAGLPDGTSVYLHCELFICLAGNNDSLAFGGKCIQNTISDCSSKRKRRSIIEEEKGRTEMVSATFTIVDEASESACPEGQVFDTKTKVCTDERLVKIKGVHLDKQWISEYADISSPQSKAFIKRTERELRGLILATGMENDLRGISIVGLSPGSVILDVLITHSKGITKEKAFENLRNMLYLTTPRMTRLVNTLSIIKEKTVELVPVEITKGNSGLDQNFVIVVVFAVIAVAFISAITLYQVQKLRRRPALPVVGVNGIDNNGMEKA